MGTTLENGIYLPDEGERNCYDGLAGNWVALDNHLGSTNIHVTINDKQAWNGHVADTTIHVTSADKQAWNGHVADTTIHVTSADKQAWNGHVADTTIHVTSADKQAWNGHVADTTIHVTSADKQAWNGHVADTTIHVTSADKQAWNGKADASALTAHTGDTTIHVTAEDKAKWDAVTSKADDSDVVHKSGNETVGGVKTITNSSLDFKSTSAEYGVSAGDSSVIFRDKNNLQTFKIYSRVFYAGVDNNLVSFYLTQKVDNTYYISNGIQLFANTGNKNAILRPILANNNADGLSVSLGDSNRRWSDVQTYKVNALEPSSLSLPSDRSARIDISSYFTNTGTGQSNSYTVPANGYIYLTLSELTNIHCFSRTSGNVTNYAQTFTKLSNSTGALYILFPVRKNDVFVATWYTTTTVSVDGAFFIPCRGNI